jgi:Protein of unknown function (DUF1302)
MSSCNRDAEPGTGGGGKHAAITFHAVAFAIGTACVAGLGTANAVDLPTDNPDIQMSLGTTVRYAVGVRTQGRDPVIANSPNSNEGDYSYNPGNVVTDRLDLLSEFDFSYQKRMGFRLSGAAWDDFAFHDDVRTNPAFADRSSYVGNRFTSYTKRYTRSSAELLDAYVFDTVNLGPMPLSIRAGQQAVLWGEAIVLSAQSVSYSQAPTDGYKALANPGVDAKETALPTGQVVGTLQVTPSLAISGQYFYDWQPTRIAEGGTYLAGTDFVLQGPTRFSITPGEFLQNQDIARPKKNGDWGINTRWSPDWLKGTVGVYYREFTETSPTISLNVADGTYRAVYPENARLYGLSLSKEIAGTSYGLELVRREKTALVSSITDGASEGARGATDHALFNAVAILGPNALWSQFTITGETAYSRWDKVTSGKQYFLNCSARPVGDQDAGTGCVTKNAWEGFFSVGPSWVAVRPGWDVAANASVLVGLSGNGPDLGSGNYRAGNYTVGLTLTYNTKHDFGIAYNGYLATYEQNAAGGIRVSNGSQIQDRGWVVLNYKGSF